MQRPYILHMLSPLRHVSPFDINMALDAGFNAAFAAELAAEAAQLEDDASSFEYYPVFAMGVTISF